MTSPDVTAGPPQASNSPIDYESVDHGPFRDLPPGAWSRDFERACVLIDEAVDDHCAAILEALGMPLGSTDGEAADRLQIAPDRRYAFDWILRKLDLAGRIQRDPTGATRGITGPAQPVPSDELTERVAGRLETAFTLIAAAAAVYPEFLRGEKSGSFFFRRPDVLQLWRRYFRNDNLAYGAINEVAAFAVETQLEGAAVRVLELGGGLGSAAEALLERSGGRIASYWFTDQLPPFLRWGTQHLEERFPDAPVESRRLDFDRSFGEQEVPQGGFELCYAVNALHAARDLLFTLGEIRSALAPGGTLVVGEAFRPRPGAPVPIEFVFQLSEDFQRFEEEECRPSGGFLHHRDWFAALERAGFSNIRTVPDIDAAVRVYPKYAMGAVLADPAPTASA